MKEIITIQDNLKPRIDIFLTKKLQDLTRSKIQKLIKDENILVNNHQVAPHYKLKENDKIQIIATDNRKEAVEAKLKKSQLTIADIKIIDETDDFLIINKPSGLIVHGGEHIYEKTLADILEEKYPQIKKVGDDPMRPGIVHRLDKEASGLMIVAKTQESFKNLKKQFQNRTIQKKYSALVHGETLKNNDIIDFPIARSSKGFKMAAQAKTVRGKVNTEARTAYTEFIVTQKYFNYTLLKVKIKTGRTHQIRVHMSAYGHSLVGDNLYSGRIAKDKNAKLNLNRIFLVADELSFLDIHGEEKKYQIKIPNNLKTFLSELTVRKDEK